MISLTASIAVAESIIAPRTYSSASRFCGGSGTEPTPAKPASAVDRAWEDGTITA